ncbi:MAG: glutamine synthetase type III, partial [Defluviitaleaceae bacterium]|nr:glutamine synthetase type III [Defluviitaleaceae bacterium]
RLGAAEAPPAIVSMYLGGELSDIFDAIEMGNEYKCINRPPMQVGVTSLPNFPKDSTDRNRTSPFAFTGDKFEFRMLGSRFSLSGFNTVLNTAVADVLSDFADELEGAQDFNDSLEKLIRKAFSNHKRVIFSGNNYSAAWKEEAEKRGLSNLDNTVDALSAYICIENTKLFGKHGVFTRAELESRYEILLDMYSKTLQIEGYTMVEIVRKYILPACFAYQKDLSQVLMQKKSCDAGLDCTTETLYLEAFSNGAAILHKAISVLKSALAMAEKEELALEQARFYQKNVIDAMDAMRNTVDFLETICDEKYWPLPSYGELLYSVD